MKLRSGVNLVSVDAVTSRGPLRTRFESVAMCGSQAPVGWGRTQQSEPATERCNRPFKSQVKASKTVLRCLQLLH